MIQYLRKIEIKLLWFQVARLRQKHKPMVIAVAGSIGKTGAKTAIATVLSEQMTVRWQDGNYNDITSVPLVFFGQKMPAFWNPFAWLKLLFMTEMQIQGSYPYQVVVVELGSDKPGDMKEFEQYFHADYGVLTAISAEHMENFSDIDAVAKEEMHIAELVDTVVMDVAAVAKEYSMLLNSPLKVGEGPYDCRITSRPLTNRLQRPVIFTLKNGESYELKTKILGRQGLPALAVSVLLASKLELTKAEILSGLEKIVPIAGRMQPLMGQKKSLIIDDTYNASPDAVISALNTLYELPVKNKIAILGQMNELGKHSGQMHENIGKHCDPKQIKLVVTIGEDANKFLADTAEKRGCKVVRCPSPYHAADVVLPLLNKDTVVLAKGSQNGVFAEEAVKELLANPQDAYKLVRQTQRWLNHKESQFHDVSK